MTGDPAAVAAVEKAYRVYSKKVPLEAGGYTMDHTALIYVVDKDGKLRLTYPYGTDPLMIAEDVQHLVNE